MRLSRAYLGVALFLSPLFPAHEFVSTKLMSTLHVFHCTSLANLDFFIATILICFIDGVVQLALFSFNLSNAGQEGCRSSEP